MSRDRYASRMEPAKFNPTFARDVSKLARRRRYFVFRQLSLEIIEIFFLRLCHSTRHYPRPSNSVFAIETRTSLLLTFLSIRQAIDTQSVIRNGFTSAHA